MGALRWVYLDADTALEVKVETTRFLRGRDRLVVTSYDDWREVDGVLIPHYQDTLTNGDSESHFLTVESAVVNPVIEDSRFQLPTSADVSLRSARNGQ